ncbi:MAG: DUF4430 domain-containing protein [bacterium]|nr:DUF4430 domain-containing protein [bacterium]
MKQLILLLFIAAAVGCSSTNSNEPKSDKDSVLVSLTVDYEGILATQEFGGVKVANGTSVADALEILKSKSDKLIYSDTIYPQIGRFVSGFSGIESQDSKYWLYCVNGRMANKGVEEMKIERDSNIKWILTNDSDPCD